MVVAHYTNSWKNAYTCPFHNDVIRKLKGSIVYDLFPGVHCRAVLDI